MTGPSPIFTAKKKHVNMVESTAKEAVVAATHMTGRGLGGAKSSLNRS